MPESRRPRRTLALAAGCAALVALLAATLLAWFAFTDSTLLDRAAAMDQPYTSITPTGEDYYLIRQLNAQKEALERQYTGEDGDQLYQAGGVIREEMIQSYTMGSYLQSLLSGLQAAGVITRGWYNAAVELIDQYSDFVYSSSDSLGFTRICVFAGYDAYRPAVMVVVESKTGTPVTLWICTSDNNPPPPVAQDCLNAWVAYCGLDGLGDWAAPSGTDYALSGLYSARGGVMASCGSGELLLEDPQACWFCLQFGVRQF